MVPALSLSSHLHHPAPPSTQEVPKAAHNPLGVTIPNFKDRGSQRDTSGIYSLVGFIVLVLFTFIA